MARWLLRLIGALECLLGVFVLIVPGAWQEAIHPQAMGTVFYPLQAMAAGWILRGALTICVTPRTRGLVAGVWLLELPASVTFWVRAGLLGPWAWPVHALRLGITGGVLVLLHRSERDCNRPGA